MIISTYLIIRLCTVFNRSVIKYVKLLVLMKTGILTRNVTRKIKGTGIVKF